MDGTIQGNKVYLTRPNKEKAASEDEIRQLERSANSYFNMGKEVYIVEKFPKNFFYFATKIRLQKVVDRVKSMPAISNAMLFRIVPSNSMH